jgi:hypothetical protein
MTYDIIAIALSMAALATSAFLALQHHGEQRRANLLPYYTKLLDDLRTLEFHDHYRYVCTQLHNDHDPQLGISGLPDDARRAVYDVAYLFQGIGMLRLLSIVSDQVMTTFDVRVVQVWDAVAPYVERERETNGTTGTYLMRTLQEFAADVRRMPPDAIDTMIERHRRSRTIRI